MLGGKIDIRVFDNHINHTYPNGHYVQNEWQRIKKEIIELINQYRGYETAKIIIRDVANCSELAGTGLRLEAKRWILLHSAENTPNVS